MLLKTQTGRDLVQRIRSSQVHQKDLRIEFQTYNPEKSLEKSSWSPREVLLQTVTVATEIQHPVNCHTYPENRQADTPVCNYNSKLEQEAMNSIKSSPS